MREPPRPRRQSYRKDWPAGDCPTSCPPWYWSGLFPGQVLPRRPGGRLKRAYQRTARNELNPATLNSGAAKSASAPICPFRRAVGTQAAAVSTQTMPPANTESTGVAHARLAGRIWSLWVRSTHSIWSKISRALRPIPNGRLAIRPQSLPLNSGVANCRRHELAAKPTPQSVSHRLPRRSRRRDGFEVASDAGSPKQTGAGGLPAPAEFPQKSGAPTVVLADLDHGGEDVVPSLLLHEHFIREHAAVPADVF